ncbi:hypothetical protein pb186bvf_017546 [Paramecium bursaria]
MKQQYYDYEELLNNQRIQKKIMRSWQGSCPRHYFQKKLHMKLKKLQKMINNALKLQVNKQTIIRFEALSPVVSLVYLAIAFKSILQYLMSIKFSNSYLFHLILWWKFIFLSILSQYWIFSELNKDLQKRKFMVRELIFFPNRPKSNINIPYILQNSLIKIKTYEQLFSSTFLNKNLIFAYDDSIRQDPSKLLPQKLFYFQMI